MKTIYSFKNYKDFIKEYLSENKKISRKVISEKLNCQASFISQVLNNDLNFSIEQAFKLTESFNLNKSESDFFILLVNFERAGTQDLKEYYKQKMDEFIVEERSIANKINLKTDLNEEFYNEYFGSWHYAAIHVFLMSDKSSYGISEIALRFGISNDLAEKVILFLEDYGLVEAKNYNYFATVKRIHLDKSSHLITQHHKNWRLKAVDSCFDTSNKSNTHYSSIITIKKADKEIINNIIFKSLKEIEDVIDDSEAESLSVLNIDFFDI